MGTIVLADSVEVVVASGVVKSWGRLSDDVSGVAVVVVGTGAGAEVVVVLKCNKEYLDFEGFLKLPTRKMLVKSAVTYLKDPRSSITYNTN